jgi:hypothetical protein
MADASIDGTDVGMFADADDVFTGVIAAGVGMGVAVAGIDLVNSHHINMAININIITPIIIIGSMLDSDSISFGSIFFHEHKKRSMKQHQ